MEYVEIENEEELLKTFFDASPEDVKREIELVLEETLRQIQSNQEVSFSVIARTNANAVYCKDTHTVRLRKGTLKRKLTDGKRYQGVWKVLQICYSLMESKKQLNQRELYYMNTDVSCHQV